MASIQLKKYYITRIQFNFSPESDGVEEKEVNFSHDVEYQNDNFIQVKINCIISDKAGLDIDLDLIGLFKVETKEGETLNDPQIRSLCERNTLSILFPYLRSSVSDISLKANIDPLILPTINILALIDENKESMGSSEGQVNKVGNE